MQLHLDLPPRAASQDLRALWSHLYQLTERLNTTVFADRPDPQPVRPEAIPDTKEESAIPLDHAAAEPTYGAGTADAYGHVKPVPVSMPPTVPPPPPKLWRRCSRR